MKAGREVLSRNSAVVSDPVQLWGWQNVPHPLMRQIWDGVCVPLWTDVGTALRGPVGYQLSDDMRRSGWTR